jgi:hypothetical protein
MILPLAFDAVFLILAAWLFTKETSSALIYGVLAIAVAILVLFFWAYDNDYMLRPGPIP